MHLLARKALGVSNIWISGIRIKSHREIVYFLLNKGGTDSAVVAYRHPFAAYRKDEVMDIHRFILLVLDLVFAFGEVGIRFFIINCRLG
jgi:hypothetical protein